MIKQRSYNEIRQSIRNSINDLDNSIDSKAGTFVSDICVSPQADELASFYTDLKLMELNQSVLTASGYDLDRLGNNYFTFRKGASTATGRVRFYIKNTNRTNLIMNTLPDNVFIPVGTQVATYSTSDAPQVVFKTTTSAYASQTDIYTSLPVDISTGFKYLEVPIICSVAGAQGNADAGEITELFGGSIEGVVGLSNVVACTGGEDQENDMSFKMRIMMAITGASLCTKAGYKKFIIQKDFVEDAVVIGAGDGIMFRDGGYIDSAKEYAYGRGGMVDIWVRGKSLIEATTRYPITSTYLAKGAPDIVLENQPVNNIVSITSVSSGKTFQNADLYDIEYGVDKNKVAHTYYKDIIWDFSVTETFNDTEYYPLNLIDHTEIEILKRKVDAELQNAKNYLFNLDYSINWSLVTYEDISHCETPPLFQKVYYNGKPYKIIAVDKRLNGRTFVKKKNKIYERVYTKPDFSLIPTLYSDEKYTSVLGKDVGGSIIAHDCVHWINKNVLQEGDTLIIKYNYNALILSLQKEMNAKRILTADILLRQAHEVKLQIQMDVSVDETHDSTEIKREIESAITRFVNNMQNLGASIEESQLAAIARGIEGVTQVNLDTVSLAIKGKIATPRIDLMLNEYFYLDTLNINVVSENTLSN